MNIKKHVTSAQVRAVKEFMKKHPDIAKGNDIFTKTSLAKGVSNSGLEKEEVEVQWQELTEKLNSMGGAVKSVDKWKKTWSYLKWKTQKQQQSVCDTSMGMSSDGQNESVESVPTELDESSKKKNVSFDEEIVKIERDKLELEREYKIQKIEVLSRIAAALEELAHK